MPDNLDSFSKLVEVVSQLRDKENGCPWDLEQTNVSLTKYLEEETQEVVEVLNDFKVDSVTGEEVGDFDALVEELGDVLLQVLLHSQIASESDKFSIEDVIVGLSEKLIRRHPHVFGDSEATTIEEVELQWERIKEEEKSKKE